jgi:nicotinamide phosphoribosyltransferase
MSDNFILLTDSYKTTHWKQYPPGTTRVYSYFEARGGRFKESVPFGMQALLQQYFAGPVVTHDDIAAAYPLLGLHFGQDYFNIDGWRHIVRDHGGRLPLHIKAVPEGTPVPVRNVLFTVENTCDQCYWLTNYAETLLVQQWYPMAVCSLSREVKKRILKALDKTGDPSLIDFKLHDFGFRGASSRETAEIGGAAHLVNFKGTDTLVALPFIAKHYGEPCAGFSIPAAEHSTITSWGEINEVDAFANILEQFPDSYVAVVSDSYDIYNAVRAHWGKTLRGQVMTRNGTLVVRPDSGDPTAVVPEVLDALGKAFGYETNAKGYRVLDKHVRVIQGDGCTIDSIPEILRQMTLARWSADNVAFGMGGGLLQQVNRDNPFSCAMKQSWIRQNRLERDVWKQPKTDSGKDSKRGRLMLVNADNVLTTVREGTVWADVDHLRTVFLNGNVVGHETFAAIRARAALDVPVEAA